MSLVFFFFQKESCAAVVSPSLRHVPVMAAVERIISQSAISILERVGSKRP